MNNRQAMDTHGSGACTKLMHHQLVSSQYKSGRAWVRGGSEVREGMVWRWGEGKRLFWGFRSNSFGEMSYWDDIPPKRGKYELDSLGAYHER